MEMTKLVEKTRKRYKNHLNAKKCEVQYQVG
jgi:hypothetical protein